jgi:hypothetical protein
MYFHCVSATTMAVCKRLKCCKYIACLVLSGWPTILNFPPYFTENLSFLQCSTFQSATSCCRVMRVGVLQGELVSPNPHQPVCMRIPSCSVVRVLFHNFPTPAVDPRAQECYKMQGHIVLGGPYVRSWSTQ